MSNTYFFSITLSLFLLSACDSKPKIIAEDTTTQNVTGEGTNVAPSSNVASGSTTLDVHQVIANDVLQAERYTYLEVTEGARKYWVATAKTEAEKGKTYLYRGGLLKTNFRSQEFDRNFDTIYLVSHIIDAAQHPGGNLTAASGEAIPGNQPTAAVAAVNVKDAVKLSDLFGNKQKYDGKIITVAGKSVKVNNGIMGKNWVHIQDGSQSKGKNLDLTITTNLNIAPGSEVALQGKIVLNKDFGSGYRYDILMEDATGVK
jgi:fructose-specific component phosphotransferase system IIB-like protein